MLQSLFIKNYALIAELNIQFHQGFSVITGETGAGKSILLGAIGLLLGQRAETRMIKTGESRCLIEAEFNLEGCDLESFFTANDLDFDGRTCILRRELTAAGKSRAFINDTPAQVSQLRELGSRLIDIHSQHQNLLLSQEDFQLSVVDIVADDSHVRQHYTSLYNTFCDATRRLEAARKAAQRGREDEDYMRFQLSQLEELNLQTGRLAEAEQEARQLEHAEEIREALYLADLCLNGDGGQQTGVTSLLRDAARQLQSIAAMLPEAQTLAERIQSCEIELKDITGETSSMAEHIEVDPSRLQAVTEWLSAVYSQQQKHHVQTEEALIALTEDFRQRLSVLDNSDEELQRLEAEVVEAQTALLAEGKKLTAMRERAAVEVEKQMQELLAPLGIPNVRFKVEIHPRSTPDASGLDQVVFLFSANKNSALQPISAIASGGEIARVMLSLKALISGAVSLPTIIFDEIDTGVSGHIAERMAQMMRQMGCGGRQVISITHLPQIAALGSHHYRVYKEDDESSTTSHIVELTPEERVTELGHMLSGAELTEAAIQNAKSLLDNV
ncbi:MAG: DNA repair protein RecN [Bacteroidaceae bacterium]|nr:DNA repair protein RecN [Bacteroidaceae bacterium]